MIYLVFILLAPLFIRFTVSVFNYLSRPFLPPSGDKTFPQVSVLIPARNEENNLPHLLEDLKKIDYPNLTIWVCDDHSQDSTSKILESYSKELTKLNYFTKNELPEGWKGKNHACYSLAQKAQGDYYLFLDADVRLSPDSISKAITYHQSQKLQLLSIFPEQIMQTKGEWNTVPIMNRILLSYLPLSLVRWKYFPSLSAANGQFMLFNSKNYEENQWHERVKNETVDDIQIARLMKKERHRTAVLLGDRDIKCRMYKDQPEAEIGFSRNIHQYFGGSRFWLSLFMLMISLRLILLALIEPLSYFYWALILQLGILIFSSIVSRQSLLKNLTHLPNQFIVLWRIYFKNLKIAKTGTSEWKGRKV